MTRAFGLLGPAGACTPSVNALKVDRMRVVPAAPAFCDEHQYWQQQAQSDDNLNKYYCQCTLYRVVTPFPRVSEVSAPKRTPVPT